MQEESKLSQNDIRASKRDKLSIIPQNANPIQNTFNEEYGVNIEEYYKAIDFCKKNNTNYKDDDFPSTQISLSNNKFAQMGAKQRESWEQIEWKRPLEFMKQDEIQLYFGDIEPNDIKQGLLGDCYFLCALSAMAEQPNLIRRLFQDQEKNDQGVYSIWLNIFGEWQNIVIDDYVPFKGNGPAFSRANGPELWVILLEKAYAKAYGSYEIIEGGNPAVALRDLTGAPYENLDRDSNLSNQEMAEQYWNYVRKHDKDRYIMTCYTDSTDVVEEENDLGLLSGHAYSILDAQEVQDNRGVKAKIFQIRNPWGRKEWKGDWSDTSDKWTQYWREKLNVKDVDDGTFWISIQDFAKYYLGVGICKVNDGYFYNSIRLDMSNSTQSLVKLTVTKESHLFVVLNQKDDKFFANEKDFNYSYLRIMVGKIEQNQFQFIGGNFVQNRECYIEDNFMPGEYVIYVEALWIGNFSRDLVVNTYSENHVTLKYIQNQDCDLICAHMLKSYALSQHSDKNIKYYQNNQQLSKRSHTAFQIMFLYYQNYTEDMLRIENIEMVKQEGFKICPPFKQSPNNIYEIQIPPGTEVVMYFKFDNPETGRTAYQSKFTTQVIPFNNNQIKDDEFLLGPFFNSTNLQVLHNQSAIYRNNTIKKNLSNKRQKFDAYILNINDDLPVELKPIEKNIITLIDNNTRSIISDWNKVTLYFTIGYILCSLLMCMFSSFQFFDLTIFLLATEVINRQNLTQQILRKIQLAMLISLVLQGYYLFKYENKQQEWISSDFIKFTLFLLQWAMLLVKIFVIICYTRMLMFYSQQINQLYETFQKVSVGTPKIKVRSENQDTRYQHFDDEQE
uniref:Calpain family cysteine protease n=1 Tax=Philasterides dicentrarchi TaxID=282688 RepID=A0A481SAK2_9CILI|nr:calpain family cysteine protease [Philasterides dicentrarchi]